MSDLREVVEGLLAGKVYADGGLKWRMRDNRVQYQSSLSEGWFTSGLGLNEIARRDFVEYKEPLSHTEAIEELMKPDGKLMDSEGNYIIWSLGKYFYKGSWLNLHQFLSLDWYKAE